MKTLLRYDRAFLIDCARRVDARMLQPNWAKLCSQFKDVCLSPQVNSCYVSTLQRLALKIVLCLLSVPFLPLSQEQNIIGYGFCMRRASDLVILRLKVKGQSRDVDICLSSIPDLHMVIKNRRSQNAQVTCVHFLSWHTYLKLCYLASYSSYTKCFITVE